MAGDTLNVHHSSLEELFAAAPDKPQHQGRRRSASDGRPSKRSKKSLRRRYLVIALTSVGVLVGLPVAALAALMIWMSSAYTDNIRTIEGNVFPQNRVAANGHDDVNILLIGSDSRDGLGDIESGSATGERADTMMFVHIPGDRKSIQVASLMRDLYVPIPNHGEEKLNAAMSYGGVPLAVETVEQLLDTRIDHVATIDFEGFTALTTAIGGVEVQSPIDFASENMPGFSFKKGSNHVAGDKALAFARERYAFADADYQRVRNQQSLILGIVSKLTNIRGVPDLEMYQRFIRTAASLTRTDSGFDGGTILSLGTSLSGVSTSDVTMFTLPTSGTGTSPGGQSIVLPDSSAILRISEALAADNLAEVLAADPDLLEAR